MVRLFVRHSVKDFQNWKQAYEQFDGARKEMGVVDHGVYTLADDANDVTLWHDFNSLESAQSFLESDRLRQAMDAAGVQGEPSIWFTHPA